MMGRLSADIPRQPGEVHAGRMLCTGEPNTFITETGGFQTASFMREEAHSRVSLAIFASGPVSRPVLASQA